jgi:predicted transposase YdaD
MLYPYSCLTNFFKNDHDYDRIERDLCELILANVSYSGLSLTLKASNNMYDITHFWDESDQQLRDEGYQKGLAAGLDEGRAALEAERSAWNEERSAWNEERKSIVDRMFHLNMSKTTICEVTGFSEAEVNAIIWRNVDVH